MSGQRGVDPPAPPDPVTHRKRPEGLGLGEGCQGLRLRSQAATSDRQPDPRGRDPVGTRSPPHPSSLQAAPAPSTRALLLPLSTAGEKGSSPSPPTARTAPGDWTSSPDCRFPALKARLLLPPAPPRHRLNGEPRAYACANRRPRP